MNIEVLERKENPLLKREEITFKIEHSGEQTPSRETVIAKLAAIINAEKQRTVLKEIIIVGINFFEKQGCKSD